MNHEFDDLTLKTKLTEVLLHVLDYGTEGDKTPIKKKLKLENDCDLWKIRSCIDLIQDTEEAIFSFSEYGLIPAYTPHVQKEKNKYIRLYGILNAVYLQSNAIIELYSTIPIMQKHKKTILGKFKELPISKIRNIVGAHTVCYSEENIRNVQKTKIDFFRIVRSTLTSKAENMLVVSGHETNKEFNLYNAIVEYNRLSEETLYNCVIEYFRRVVKSKKYIDEILHHYNVTSFYHFDYEGLYKNEY